MTVFRRRGGFDCKPTIRFAVFLPHRQNLWPTMPELGVENEDDTKGMVMLHLKVKGFLQASVLEFHMCSINLGFLTARLGTAMKEPAQVSVKP